MSANVIRVVNFQTSTSATTTSNPIDVDYRFGGVRVRTFFVVKSAATGPSIFIEGAPTSTGPWIAIAEVTSGCTTTIVETIKEVPFVRTSYAGGGPIITIVGVV